MSSLNNLKSHKDDILKAEISCLLFNLGKTHIGINNWKDYFPDAEQIFFSYKNYFTENHFENETKYIDEKLFDFFTEKKFKINDTEISLLECMQAGESKFNFIKKIMFRGCENINSGIDKGAPSKQMQKPLYLSNAFGTFKQKIDEKMFDRQRSCFWARLFLEIKNKNWFDTPDWVEIRNYILNEIKIWYSDLLSDSRFPANDVTLFDQVYMTASMFKAVLAEMYIDHNKVNVYNRNPRTIRWQIFGIQYDKLALAEKGFKPSYISWYREQTQKIDNDIKKYLETDLGIANEIYRDETGIYFLFPVGFTEKFSYNDKLQILKDDYKEILENIFRCFEKNNIEEEIFPVIFLSKASRGIMNLTYLLKSAKENFLYAPLFINKIRSDSKKSNSENSISFNQLCRICRINPVIKNSEKDENIPVCEKCRERKQNRLEKWLEKRKDTETIWLDEVQDKNSRIALITIRFELMEWLNGNMLNSTLCQQLDFNTLKNKDIFCEIGNAIKNNKKLDDTILKDYRGDIPNQTLKELLQSFLLERSIGDQWEDLILEKIGNSKIDFEKRKIVWEDLRDDNIKFLSTILLQFLLRKNPSPPGLRRIWETTKEFNKKISNIIRNEFKIWRLVFNLKNDCELTDGEWTYCGVVFWIRDKKAYLITNIENALPVLLNEKIKKEDLNKIIYEKKFDEVKNKLKNNFDVISSKDNPPKKLNYEENIVEIEDYYQLFTILDPTPISYQFAIPANKVPEIISLIKREYKKEFPYVYGKLPFHIGVVIQNYKSPLYTGLTALRNIRMEIKNLDDIKIVYDGKTLKSIQKNMFQNYKSEELANSTEKYYSLYLREDNAGDYNFYFPPKSNKNKLSGSTDSNESDKFIIYPNTIDFEYLDTNTRRNDIFYKKGKRLNKWRKMRPYTFEEWEKVIVFKELFDKSNSSQLQNLVSNFYSLLEDWNNSKSDNENSIKLLASALIKNVLKPKKIDLNLQNKIACLFGADKMQGIPEKITIQHIEKFIDYYYFWHKALKEV